MALLVGRHVNKIDKKGRVSIPKPFRLRFRDQEFSGLYVFPSFKYPAIEACDESFMQRLSESLDEMEMFSDDQDDLASVILENAHALPFDPEGRVVLPGELVELTGLSDQALFVGGGARFRIWNPETYNEHRSDAFSRARSRGATLKLKPSHRDGEDGE